MKRREFIPKAFYGTTIIAAVPLLTSSCEKDEMDGVVNNPGGGINPPAANTVDLNDPDYSSLNNEGGSAYFDNKIIINKGNKNYIALSSICTHYGCTVDFVSSANNLSCPCHGSQFSITGSVLQGPASSALQSFAVTKNGDILTIG